MDKVIAAIRFKELDSATASDLEVLLAHNKMKADARSHAVSMAISVGGREIGEHESDLVIEVPLEASNIIRDIHSRLADDLEISTTIGVGDDLKDAKLALDWAIDHRPATIKVMEPMIEQQKQSSDDEDKFDYFQPEQVAIDQEGRPMAMRKSSADGKPDDWADESETVSDETKQKIAAILQMLQSKREYLNQLQQTNPEVYQGVLGVVQSIAAMAQAAREGDAKKHSKMMTKIARHLENSETDHLEDESAKVLEMLIDAQSEAKAKKDQEFGMRLDSKMQRHKVKRNRALKHTEKHGGNHKFFMNLHRMMKG